MVYVGETEEEGRAGGDKLLWFLNTSLKSAPQTVEIPAGHDAAGIRAAGLSHRAAPGGRRARHGERRERRRARQPECAPSLMSLGADEAMQQGILFCGTPDSVYRQIMEFYDKVGGFGHLAMIGRSGFMTHDEAVKGIKLFSREVAPRLREVKPVVA